MEIIEQLESLWLGQAAQLEGMGHLRLAAQLRAEVQGDAVPATVATTSVRRMFEEDLELLQNLVVLLQREGHMERLEEAERQLDWFEQQVFAMQELGEQYYLVSPRA